MFMLVVTHVTLGKALLGMSEKEVLDRAMRAIDELVATQTRTATPTEAKPSAGVRGAGTLSSTVAVFPHCPRCASYALYRRNNIGSYECQTCGLLDISEESARRTQ